MATDQTALEVQLARVTEQLKALREAFAAERVSSKEAITAAFTAAETATAAALLAQKESAEKSEENAKDQLEMHNGLIRKMDALVGSFPNKESVQKDLETRDTRIVSLEKTVARAYGAAAGAVALAGIAVAIVLSTH
jgi:hypothetical protein